MPDNKKERIALESDVFTLTSQGEKELRGSGTSLSPSALEVLVLIDGKSTAGETASRCRTLKQPEAMKVLSWLLQEHLIQIMADDAVSLDFVDFFQPRGPITPSAEAAAKAKKMVAATTALLQEKGYTVRIARRADARPAENASITVLVVEDEPHLSGMLKHVFSAEGFKVRTAMNREQILEELRKPPLPDLVLLDVVLPDADGFDVLEKMRDHPALKRIPIVMLTAQATRDAVLRGLTGGCDGYITKPFRIDALTKAVATVLGLPQAEPQGEDDPWSL